MKKKVITAALALLLVLGIAVIAAPQAEAAAATKTLSANTASLSINADTELDLNGYSITTLTVNSGVTVTLKDSQTDDYNDTNGRGYGKIATVNGNGTVKAAAGYLLAEENGTSAHKLNLKVTGVVLRATDMEELGASVYYQCTFGGDQTVKDTIVTYGVALGAGRMPDFREKSYTRYENLNNWTTGAEFSDNSTLLDGILKTENAYTINRRNSTLDIYCQAYVELADGSRITGDAACYSLRDIVEGSDTFAGVERRFDALSDQEKTAAGNLYTAFTDIVEQWALPRVRQSLVGGDYQICNPGDMYLLAEKPDADYILMNNVNMEGFKWPLVTNFSGTFDGNNKNVSNLKVDTGSGIYIGMFNTVAADGVITNLHLRDVLVDATGLSTARYIGTLAGRNSGRITGCNVTGRIVDNKPGTDAAYIFVGALAGRSETGSYTAGTGLSITETVPDVLGKMQTFTTSNLAAQICMDVPDSEYVMRRLVGNPLGGSTTISGLWQDLSFSTKYDTAELQRRRQVVVNDAYEQGTIKWTPATTIRYYADQVNFPSMTKGDKDYHIHNMTFTPGKVYIGVPYTHCASPIEQVKYYMNPGSNGVYTLKNEVTAIKGGSDNTAGTSTWSGGEIGWGKYFGSDCSGSLTTAWHKVSPILTSTKTNGGVSPFYSTNLVPSQYNQWYYGFQQVGNYKVDDATWSGGTAGKPVTAGDVTMTDYTMDTDDIFKKIGANGFYEAYARSQMGDMVVAYSRTGKVGHVRMIARDPVVIRNAAGTIDRDKSYFLFHEQGAGLYDTPGVSSWRINWKCSFREAAMQNSGQTMGGNGNGYYLPITMKAFHDTTIIPTGGIATGGTIVTGNDPKAWALNSFYRIMSATLVIKDAQGNVKYNATRFQGTSSSQNRRRCVPGAVPLFVSDVFSDCCGNLVEGQTYYATFSGTTYSGITNTMMNNVKFTYTPS